MTPQQKLVLNTAYYLEVKKCMSDQGFTLLDPPPKLEVPTYGPVLFDGYIGILDVDYAKKYGYQLFTPAISPTDQGPQSINGDPKYEYALKVAGGSGCDGLASQMIEKNLPSEEQSTPLLAKIYNDSLSATYASPAYKKALRSWSTCMRNAGFNYSSPNAAFSAYKGFEINAQNAVNPSPPHPSSLEIDTAVTDVGCKRSSDFANVFRQVLWDQQLAMAAKDHPTLEVIEKINTRKLLNAQQMIKELG